MVEMLLEQASSTETSSNYSKENTMNAQTQRIIAREKLEQLLKHNPKDDNLKQTYLGVLKSLWCFDAYIAFCKQQLNETKNLRWALYITEIKDYIDRSKAKTSASSACITLRSYQSIRAIHPIENEIAFNGSSFYNEMIKSASLHEKKPSLNTLRLLHKSLQLKNDNNLTVAEAKSAVVANLGLTGVTVDDDSETNNADPMMASFTFGDSTVDVETGGKTETLPWSVTNAY